MIIALPSYSAGQHYSTFQTIPDAGAVQDFIVRLLNQRLNAEITYANARRGDGVEAMPLISRVKPAPAKIGDTFIDNCLVGLYVKRNQIMERLIENRGCVLSIFLIDRKIEGETDIAPLWRRADVVTSIIEPFSGGFPFDSSPKYWHELLPVDVTILPEAWANYSGVSLNYSLWQAPGAEFSPDA